MPAVHIPGLWRNKVEAITSLEKSLYEDRPRALTQMATGSGKTLLAITAIYRLIKYGGARRVLFLVDRQNLGEQAEKEFQGYRTPDDNRKFTELYNVQRLTSNTIASSTKVVITTIQRLYSMLKGEPDLDPEVAIGRLVDQRGFSENNHDGVVDASGNSGGTVSLTATDEINLQAGGLMADGQVGNTAGDGGELTLTAATISVGAAISATGADQKSYQVNIPTDIWFHLAATYVKNGALTVYLNGKIVASGASGRSPTFFSLNPQAGIYIENQDEFALDPDHIIQRLRSVHHGALATVLERIDIQYPQKVACHWHDGERALVGLSRADRGQSRRRIDLAPHFMEVGADCRTVHRMVLRRRPV
jgi:hypothetical protein